MSRRQPAGKGLPPGYPGQYATKSLMVQRHRAMKRVPHPTYGGKGPHKGPHYATKALMMDRMGPPMPPPSDDEGFDSDDYSSDSEEDVPPTPHPGRRVPAQVDGDDDDDRMDVDEDGDAGVYDGVASFPSSVFTMSVPSDCVSDSTLTFSSFRDSLDGGSAVRAAVKKRRRPRKMKLGRMMIRKQSRSMFPRLFGVGKTVQDREKFWTEHENAVVTPAEQGIYRDWMQLLRSGKGSYGPVLPKTVIGQAIRGMLPNGMQIADEAKRMLQYAAETFIVDHLSKTEQDMRVFGRSNMTRAMFRNRLPKDMQRALENKLGQV